jgi:hypothetical protein
MTRTDLDPPTPPYVSDIPSASPAPRDREALTRGFPPAAWLPAGVQRGRECGRRRARAGGRLPGAIVKLAAAASTRYTVGTRGGAGVSVSERHVPSPRAGRRRSTAEQQRRPPPPPPSTPPRTILEKAGATGAKQAQSEGPLHRWRPPCRRRRRTRCVDRPLCACSCPRPV